MTAGNMCKEFGKVRQCGFRDIRADRTERLTGILITSLRTSPGTK